MKQGAWFRFRVHRSLLVVFAILLYIFFAFLDVLYIFPYLNTINSTAITTWLIFGFSLSVALIFLAVGSLIWFYSYNRLVATLIFVFSIASMITFELETASTILPSGTNLTETIANISSSIALSILAIALLIFPRNHFLIKKKFGNRKSSIVNKLTIIYIAFLIVALILDIVSRLIINVLLVTPAKNQLFNFHSISVVLALIGSIIAIIISFNKSSIREREQLQFFASGVLIALSPLLLLTVIPGSVTNLTKYAIDSRLTTVTVVLLPLSLGYAVLRYQILVLDSYIRQTVSRIIGLLLLVMLAYVEYVFYLVLRETLFSLYDAVALMLVSTIILAPLCWTFAKTLTERFIFKESLRYRRMLETPVSVGREVIDLDSIGQLITESALQTFKTVQVALFVLVEETGYYKLFPKFQDEQNTSPRRALADRCIAALLQNSASALTDELELPAYIEKRLFSSRRPLFLYEVTRSEADMPTGLSRYLTSALPSERSAPLVAPIRSQGKMIAFLVLGERPDKQSYAGPDFDIVELVLSRYSSLLNTAQLQARSRQHEALLNNLYKTGTIAINETSTIESTATAYAKVAAEATGAGVEIWLYNENEKVLEQKARIGSLSSLSWKPNVEYSSEVWRTYYYVGTRAYTGQHNLTAIPPCLNEKPDNPFVWLPLELGESRQGLLIFTFSRPHLFLAEEMRVLEMFAEQCSTAIENTHITMELRSAYERQKELDVLKDQFIMTASHELRTPLTAVLGYLELLKEYDGSLRPAISADFIGKAYRGCEELALMVNNIMDANYIGLEVENSKIGPTSLYDSVHHIVDIVESLTIREHRAVTITIEQEICVLADSTRLHQVLLNLINNAIKYSPQGTPIEISSSLDASCATVAVHDYGLGIPEVEQGQLFERFVRLERDMNSPVRGAGLGLYISRQLIKSMGGTIWLCSAGKPGEGSTFYFTLPLAPK